MKYTLILLCAVFAGAQPAGVTAFQHWTSKDLKTYAGKLRADKAPGKMASEALGNWGNSMAQITRRDGDGEAEFHENFVDFFIVEAGEASVIVGGEVVTPRTTGPGEIRGASITGGQRVQLKAGDIMRIPAKTAHQVLVPKSFLYYVIKVKQ
jgi:mannose-6-phosphate isomerase-like protein (cupin superfamily)